MLNEKSLADKIYITRGEKVILINLMKTLDLD